MLIFRLPSARASALRILARLPVLVFLLLLCPLTSSAQDWVAEVRRLTGEKKFADAHRVIETQLRQSPGNLEAIGWRGRVNAWTGNFAEAEKDYRRVLQTVPNELEIMLSLADVLLWQQRYEEALEVAERATPLLQATPLASEAAIRRGRALRALGRADEARTAFARAAQLDPSNAEARSALAGLARPPRHEVRFGLDYDTFSFTGDAQAYTISLRSDVAPRWTTNASVSFFNRFGEKPVRGGGSVTFKATPRDAFTFGAAGADHRGIIAKSELFFDYDRGFKISETAPLRGIELNLAPRWLWFRGAQIFTLTPSAILYLPRDWTFTIQTTAARSRFTGIAPEWRPSGLARLAFPVHRKVTLNTFFAVGTENFARVDQVGRFSARAGGGGGRWQFAPRQDVSFYAFYQDRSQGRSQTSFGLSYGFRF